LKPHCDERKIAVWLSLKRYLTERRKGARACGLPIERSPTAQKRAARLNINALFSEANFLGKSDVQLFKETFHWDPEYALECLWEFIRDVSTCPVEVLEHTKRFVTQEKARQRELTGSADYKIQRPVCG